MNAVIYARYSNQKQNEQSIEGQIADCTAYANRKGYNVIGTYIDRAMTGRNDDRDDFQRMLADTAKHTFEIIIVWKIDRFGRNREEIALNKYKCKKNGVKVVYAQEHIPESPEGVLLEALLEGMAEYFSLDLAQKVNRGMHQTALKCQITGGTMPLGYMAKDKKYVINPNTAPMVEKIYTMYANGHTFTEICTTLNCAGYRTSTGVEFNKNSLHRILTNKKYIGIYTYKDVEIPGGIPAIISEELFYKVQKLNRKKGGRKAMEKYLLSGKAYCGICGTSMVGESGKSSMGTKYHYYKCRNNKIGRTCKAEAIPKDKLEQIVLEETINLLTTEKIDYIANRAIEAQKVDTVRDASIKATESQLTQVERSLSNLIKTVEMGVVSDTISARIAELETQKKQLSDELLYLQNSKIVLTHEQIVYFLSKFKNADMSESENRERLFEALVNHVKIYPDKIEIAYNYIEKTSISDSSETLALVTHRRLEPRTT